MNLRSPVEAPASGLELESYLPYRLLTATNAVSRLIARAYEDRFGLTAPQWRVVCVLAQDGPASLEEIAQRLLVDRSAVSRATLALTRRRLVERLATGKGGRRTRMVLTQEGVRLHGEVAPLALAYEAALIAGLAPDEVKLLKRLLSRLQLAALGLAGTQMR
jgi:DNA-binding MarR family transcriptional regulator